MEAEELEFAISQLADGTLNESARPALERRLAADPAARKVLADYRALDAALRAAPLPEVAWGELTGRISAAIDEAELPVGVSERAGLADSRRAEPARLRIWPWWAGAGLAMAATLLIGIGLGMRWPRPVAPAGRPEVALLPAAPSPVAPVAKPAAAPVVVAVVSGPAAEAAAGAAVADVSIGPSPSVAETNSGRSFADSVIYRPPGVIIGSGNNSGQDDADVLPSLYQH